MGRSASEKSAGFVGQELPLEQQVGVEPGHPGSLRRVRRRRAQTPQRKVGGPAYAVGTGRASGARPAHQPRGFQVESQVVGCGVAAPPGGELGDQPYEYTGEPCRAARTGQIHQPPYGIQELTLRRGGRVGAVAGRRGVIRPVGGMVGRGPGGAGGPGREHLLDDLPVALGLPTELLVGRRLGDPVDHLPGLDEVAAHCLREDPPVGHVEQRVLQCGAAAVGPGQSPGHEQEEQHHAGQHRERGIEGSMTVHPAQAPQRLGPLVGVERRTAAPYVAARTDQEGHMHEDVGEILLVLNQLTFQ